MSVFKNKHGTWEVRWREGDRQRARNFQSKKDAQWFEREVRRSKALGAHAPAQPSSRTLENFTDEWMERGKPRWSSNTYAQRVDIIGRWVTPHIGHVPLKQLGTERLEEWRLSIIKQGCPPNQANQALRVVSAALGTAVKWRQLPDNPCRNIDAIPTERNDHAVVTPADIEQIRRNLADPMHRFFVSVMGYAGLRPGEALALEWSDIQNGHIRVRRSVQRDGTISRPKSRSAYRTVPMIGALATEAEELRQQSGLVFRAPRSMHPMNWGNWTKRYFRPAIDAAGLSLRPYDLRHAYASLMIQAGESVIVVAARMGHSRPSMTLDVYAHDYQMKDAVGIATPDEMVDLARADVCVSFVPTENLVDISSHRKERNAC